MAARTGVVRWHCAGETATARVYAASTSPVRSLVGATAAVPAQPRLFRAPALGTTTGASGGTVTLAGCSGALGSGSRRVEASCAAGPPGAQNRTLSNRTARPNLAFIYRDSPPHTNRRRSGPVARPHSLCRGSAGDQRDAPTRTKRVSHV